VCRFFELVLVSRNRNRVWSAHGCSFRFKESFLVVGLLAGLAAGLAQAGGMKIEIVERERHFRAGEVVARTVRLDNNAETTMTAGLVWTAAIPPAVLETGMLTALLPPRQPVAIPLRFRLPPVRRTVQAQLILSAEAGPGERAERVDWLRVYPGRLKLPWAFLAKHRIGVLDPGDKLAARLRTLGARPEVQLSPRDAEDFKGDLLLVGEDCFKGAAEWTRWREGVRRRGGAATSVVVLHQAFAADPGGAKGAGTWAEPELTAAGRALLRELDPADLSGWHGGGAVRGPWLPLPPGRCLSLLRPAGTDDQTMGISTSALLVEPLGPGRALERCQVPLLARWEAEPACELLLNTLMRKAVSGAFLVQRN
jgi:hypothetical protein